MSTDGDGMEFMDGPTNLMKPINQIRLVLLYFRRTYGDQSPTKIWIDSALYYAALKQRDISYCGQGEYRLTAEGILVFER